MINKVGWGVLQLEAASFGNGKLCSVHDMAPEDYYLVCGIQNFQSQDTFL